MTLRQKTLLLIGVTLISLLGVLYFTLSSLLMSYLWELEEKKTRLEVKRAIDALSEDVAELSVVARQWGAWDDTYGFLRNSDRRFLQSNFDDSVFFDFRLNLVLITRPSGQIVHSRGLNLKQHKTIPLPPQLIEVTSQLQQTDLKSGYRGILLLSQGPLLIASQPIIKTDGRGPAQGNLVIGRFLDNPEIEHLEALNQLSLTIHTIKDPDLPKDFQVALSELENSVVAIVSPEVNHLLSTEEFVIQPLNNDIMSGYALLRDISGNPALLLRVNTSRAIYKQGLLGLRYLILSILIVGLIFGIGTLLLLEKLVLLRLARLSEDVKSIGDNNDLSMRVLSSGKDELSSLGSNINWMLEALESSLKDLKAEREKAEQLLLNILPESIAYRLKKDPQTIAESFSEATILFADIVGFTKLAAYIPPVDLVNLLNQIFSAFDQLAELHGLEKIKTIGDAYMVVGGLPIPRADHTEAVADMALDMLTEIERFNVTKGVAFSMRIGINSGPVVAGVIGLKKFIYDLWGDTVNIASRMESHGLPGRIQVSEFTYKCLKDKYEFEKRGGIQVKGRGEMITYLLIGRKEKKEIKDSSNNPV